MEKQSLEQNRSMTTPCTKTEIKWDHKVLDRSRTVYSQWIHYLRGSEMQKYVTHAYGDHMLGNLASRYQ